MKRIIVFIISLIILISCVPFGSVGAYELPLKEKKELQLIVKYKPGRIAAKSYRMENVERLKSDINIITAKNRGDLDILYSQLKADKSVEYVEKNGYLTLHSIPNDKFYADQWELHAIDAAKSFDYSIYAKKPITVAVIDTGINSERIELQGKVTPGGWNFLDDTDDVTDMLGHGTAVSGIITALTDNGLGVASVCGTFDVRILPLKVADTVSFNVADAVRAIQFAADFGVDVINMSFGTDDETEYNSIKDSVQYAYEQGCVLVASAGNDKDARYSYPASCDNVISVGAVANDLQRADFSNYNDRVDLTAPGVGIHCLKHDGDRVYGSSGTSFSAPMVAGVAAVIKALAPSMTPDEVEQILKNTALDLGEPGRDNYFGYGLVQSHDAVLYTLDTVSENQTGMLCDDIKMQYPVFVLEDGSEAEGLSEGFTVKATIFNDSENPATVTVLTALYNGNRLAGLYSKDLQIPADDTLNYIEPIDMEPLPDVDTLKVFVLSDTNSIVPKITPVVFN